MKIDNFFIIWIIASIVNCIVWIPILLSKQTKEGYVFSATLLIEIPALILAIIQPSPIVYWVIGGCVLNFLTTYVMAVKRGFYNEQSEEK